MIFPWVCEMKKYGGDKLSPCIRDREQFFTWCSQQFKEGQKVWLTVKKPDKNRTHEQFKYLYSCVYPFIAEALSGDSGALSVEEVDGIMKRRHLVVNPDTPLEYVKNKTDLDRSELARFIDDVRRDAAGMNIETMDPLQNERADHEQND